MKPTPAVRRAVLVLLAVALVGVGCAPGRSIVRGNWPDGRIEAPARPAVRTPPRPPAKEAEPAPPVGPREEWLPAEAGSDASASDLNRRGVLRPIYYDFDSDRIRDDQVAVLEANAAWLRENPGARIVVEGHCDERGTREYNLALGERRARAARDFLVSLGIEPDRIETVSYGEELPVDPGHDEAAWAKNRRAEFVIVAVGR